jgi:hypothetical protein
MRYRLHTLLILTAIGPPLIAGAWLGRDKLLAEATAGLDTLVLSLIIGMAAVCVSGIAAALTVEMIDSLIDNRHRRS